MKTKPWPTESISYVQGVLKDSGFKIWRKNWWRHMDLELSDYWFVLEPLYGDIIVTLNHDYRALYISEILDNPDDHPKEILNTCLFLIPHLR